MNNRTELQKAKSEIELKKMKLKSEKGSWSSYKIRKRKSERGQALKN
jgi:hypothetical protein